jgi:hypothetical protein
VIREFRETTLPECPSGAQGGANTGVARASYSCLCVSFGVITGSKRLVRAVALKALVIRMKA